MEEARIQMLAGKIIDALFDEGYRVNKMTFEAAKHFVRDNEIANPNE